MSCSPRRQRKELEKSPVRHSGAQALDVLLAVDVAVHECDHALAGQRLLEQKQPETLVRGRSRTAISRRRAARAGGELNQVGDG